MRLITSSKARKHHRLDVMMKCGSECSRASHASRGLPNSYIGDMTKIATAIGGTIGTLADKVHTPIAARSLTVPTRRRDVKPVETRPP
ncbi:MAG: hypothetical protein ACFFCD_14410 [Promethearchaeota archaeon]